MSAFDFTLTRDELIRRALAKIGVLDTGEVPGQDQIDDAATQLNLIIKEILADGGELWLRSAVTLFLAEGQQTYLIGPSGDHAATQYVDTTLAADAADMVLTVADGSGIKVNDAIGVKGAMLEWTTVTGINGNDVTVADNIVAASGARVYAYTDKTQRPRRLLFAYRRNPAGIDTPVGLISRQQYELLADKATTGLVNQAHYDRALTNGKLFVWPTGDGDTDKLVLIAEGTIEDVDLSTDNPQFPVEWFNFLVWQLAFEMSYEFGVQLGERDRLERIAAVKREVLFAYDVGEGPLEIGMRQY